MKQLLIGNHAMAQGLYEGGMAFISGYPGTPSTEITEHASTFPDIISEWAPNEKVALEAVFGASLAGVRAACTMKHVGLNVAADPLFSFSYTGVRGGAVICVADDPAMHSSQNEQDSRHYAIAAKLPMLEPSDSAEAHDYAKLSFALSEQFDTPVLLRMCTRISHSQSMVEVGERIPHTPIPYQKQAEKYVLVPANAKRRHPVVEARMKALAEYAETCPFNAVEWGKDRQIGVVTSGTCYQYVKEALGDSVSVFKLGLVNPLPVQSLMDFASQVKRLVVVEELDGIIEAHCVSLGLKVDGKNLFSVIGEYSQDMIRKAFGLDSHTPIKESELPLRPPMMCAGCPHRSIFYVLSKLKLTVMGDIGCYTLGAQPPLSALDTALCMGASLSGLHGYLKARPDAFDQTVGVIGDSTFIHSGMTSLCEIAYNQSPATVIVLDNSITGMTGHQQNPSTGYTIHGDPTAKVNLEAFCHAIGIQRVSVVDPYDMALCEKVLREELATKEPSVIISRRPCVLLKQVKAKPALTIDTEKCRRCKRCMALGCPALSISDMGAAIDSTLCVGCEVCLSLCPFDAIKA